jgi:hypothetical protein
MDNHKLKARIKRDASTVVASFNNKTIEEMNKETKKVKYTNIHEKSHDSFLIYSKHDYFTLAN